MANVLTSVSGTSPGNNDLATNVVLDAYDKYVEHALRHSPILRDVADKRPVQVDKPGDNVTLQVLRDLSAVTSALTETADVDAVAMPATDTVNITVAEYGNAIVETRLLREFSLFDVEPATLENLAYNMRDSIDILVRDKLSGGTNVQYAGDATSTATVQSGSSGDLIDTEDVQQIVTKLRVNAAVPRNGELYWCGIHPHVALDLRRDVSESGNSSAWRDPHTTTAQGAIWRGEVGVYEGAFFVESARMKVAQDGTGDTGTQASVYRTIFAGRQALAEATAVEPHVVLDGAVGADKLRRFYTVGWYGVLGWAVYRQAALYRLESGASLGTAGVTA